MEQPTTKKTIVQKLKKPVEDQFATAEKYYSLLSALNGLKLTQREIQLVAFTAIRGNISYANIRQEFCEKYDSLAFNPALEYLPLETFVPMIYRVFEKPKRAIYRPKP